MATIITVHGTYAHIANPPGVELAGAALTAPWWQPGSEFDRELRSLLESPDGRIDTIAFTWSGANSETERRNAGAALLQRMRELEARREPYVVIGHSHGGSVISHALILAAARREKLPYLQRWLTVGTPFVELRKERFLFLRLPIFMKAAFVASLMLLIMFVFATLGDIVMTATDVAEPYALGRLGVGFGLTALPFIAFLLVAVGLDRSQLFAYRASNRQRANETFVPRWYGLTHEADEAVRGLATLRAARLQLFDKGFAVPAISILAVFLLPVAYFALLLSPPAIVGIAEYLRDNVYKVAERAPADAVTGLRSTVREPGGAAQPGTPTGTPPGTPDPAGTAKSAGEVARAPAARPAPVGSPPPGSQPAETEPPTMSGPKRLNDLTRRLAARRADRVGEVSQELRKLRREIVRTRKEVDDAGTDLAGRLEANERLRQLVEKRRKLRETVEQAFPDLPEITRASRFRERFLEIGGKACPNNSLCYAGTNITLNSQLLYHVVTDEVAAMTLDGQGDLGAWGHLLRSLVPILLVPTVFMVIAILLVLLVQFIAGFVSVVTSRWLDLVTWDEVKRAAFGNDAEAEVALGAASGPVWAMREIDYLPAAVAQPISERSDREMALSVAKIRATLRDIVVSEADAGGTAGFTSLLTWRELIHTSYFDVPAFVRLVAAAIVETDGFKPSARLESDPSTPVARQWLASLPTKPSGARPVAMKV
ncbi:MAG: hypothetical protein NW217_10720 [Hyphomicrobiaceae bacterium]|nr:hypothetical protein [Hyphomicrobiaceae bacterium]